MSMIIDIHQLNHKKRNVEEIIHKALRKEGGIITFGKTFHLYTKGIGETNSIFVSGILLSSKLINGHNEPSYQFIGQYRPTKYKTPILLSLEGDLTLTWNNIISTANDAPYMIDYLSTLI